MCTHYWILDWRCADRFRSLESRGCVWQIDHYFLSKGDLPEWLRADPDLDFSKLDLHFSDRPKSKEIPDLLMSAGLLYLRGSIYDNAFVNVLTDCVSAFPLVIGGEKFYFLRPDITIECVDEDRSVARRRDDGFRYSWPRLVLKDVPEDAPAVFLPGAGREFWKYPVFSDEFVEVCKSTKVVGAVFKEVYPLACDTPDVCDT